jgi:ATP-dependent RNA helicase SUPV3L1/SUV3
LKERARGVAQAFVADTAGPPPASGLGALPDPPPSQRQLSAFGLRAVGRFTAPVEWLEALAERRARGGGRLADEDLAALGVSEAEARALLAALKTPRAQLPERQGRKPTPVRDSPFAALSALTAPEPAPTRRRRPRRRRTAGS